MKKFISLFIAIMMIVAAVSVVSAAEPVAAFSVPKCETAPVIDGVISEGEYKLISVFDETKSEWNYSSSATDENDLTKDKYTLEFYATWDDNYFYPAVKVTCNDATHPTGPSKWVFTQHSLMSAMVYGDPLDATFKSANGEAWEWGAAYAASFSREWSIGNSKTDGVEFPANHFANVTGHTDFKWKATTADGFDIYEQAIPWAAISDGDNKVNATVGGKVGYAFSCCVDSDTESDENGTYICLAGGINGGKAFDKYAQITLAANEPFVDDSSDTSSDTSSDDSSKDETPDTGDISSVFAVIAVVAAAAAVIVAKKRRA